MPACDTGLLPSCAQGQANSLGSSFVRKTYKSGNALHNTIIIHLCFWACLLNGFDAQKSCDINAWRPASLELVGCMSAEQMNTSIEKVLAEKAATWQSRRSCYLCNSCILKGFLSICSVSQVSITKPIAGPQWFTHTQVKIEMDMFAFYKMSMMTRQKIIRYGKEGERKMLHAEECSFNHP